MKQKKLFTDRLDTPTYYQFGAYQLQIELLRALFLDGEDKPPRLQPEAAQAQILADLGMVYGMTGQPRRAIVPSELHNKLREKAGDKKNLARGFLNVAIMQLMVGMLSAAERNMHRQIDLGREIGAEFDEAVGHLELGRVLSYRGVWQEAEQELEASTKIFEKIQHFVGIGLSWSYKALREILMAHESMEIFNFKTIQQFIQNAVNAQSEWSKRNYPMEREKVRNTWLLGATYLSNNELTLAEENLSKALNLCRQINSVDAEAEILLDIARLRYAQGDFKDAQEKASEALVITERSGYVLQGADVNLFLAQYALEQEKDKVKAKEYALEAKKLATGWEEIDGKVVYDTTGKYIYKVAYEEAEAMLKRLK